MSKLILIFLLGLSLQINAQQRPTIKNGLESFVRANTIYPMYAKENCIQGNIEVAFKINKEGKITYAGITEGIGADLDAEALRLIKLTSGKWTVPAGYDTTFLIRSPMKFSLQDFGCEQINPGSVGLAIKQYNDDMASFSKIANYYRNIEKGIENFIEEEKIIALKNEMGVDDDYLTKKIAIAEKKISQGDLQSACEDFKFVKYMGSTKADKLLAKYCK
ncbi:TonB family protein [Pedobacter sp. SL55]|uniref:TonB family protein n=1 Tax=Pedobacter sp. SL55 TaxID=2995161 RepID=UPI0022709D65|nr:TonB family protein [Pedobacter sp. SL55]WAC41469.1 TonB family protein [Pedobacter sp. SL55]